MTTDNFALQLAVGVKDMFGDKVDEIESKSKELLETSKALQKGLGDITAFKAAEQATGRLSKHKADLTEQLENQQSQLAKLYKEQAKLNNVEKDAGELNQEQKQSLAKLNDEIKAAKRNQKHLQMELANTGQELKDQERNTKRLSNALEAAGIDTRKFDKSLEKLEAELKDVNKELEQTEKLAEGLSFGEQLSGGALGAGLTAALGAGAVAAYEWDKGLKQLKTTTQLTEEQVQQLKGPLKGLQAKLGIDTTELIGAAAKINQQTGLIDAELASAVQSALTLQRVNSSLGIEIDASEIIRAQTQMRTAWNVSFASSGDLISTIYQKAGDRADDLLDTFHEYSPLMAEMGLSAEQVSAILIKGAEAGVYNYDYLADTMKEARAQLTDSDNWAKLVGTGEKAGLIDEMLGNDSASANRIKTQLAEFRQGLNSDNKTLQSDSFSKLMLELTSVYKEDAQKARGLIEAVFAAKGADDMPIKTLEAMALGMQNYQSILGDYHNKTQTQLEEQLTGWDRLGIAGRKLTQAWTSGVERLGVVAEPVIDMVVYLAEGVAAFAEQHPDVAAFVVALAAGAAVVASLAAAVSVLGFAAIGMKTGMASLLAGARWLTPVFTGLGKAALFLGRGLLLLAANPVGLTLMAIAGAGYLLYKNWDSLSEMASNLWDKLTAPLSLLWDLTPIKLLWDAGQQLYDWWQAFDLTEVGVNLLGSLLDGALSILGTVGSTIRDGISEIFSWGNDEEQSQLSIKLPIQKRSNDASTIALAAGLAASSPIASSNSYFDVSQFDTPEIQPLQVIQPKPSPVHLTPPETVLNMPEPMNIDIGSPEDIEVTAPQVTVPDITPIEFKAPKLDAPEIQPFQVTQPQPSPVHLTPPETVFNMPEPMNIDIGSPEDIKVLAPQVTVPDITPIEFKAPKLDAPEIQTFQVTQPQPSPVHLTPPETVLNMPEPMNIDIGSPEDIKITAPQVTVPDITPIEFKEPKLDAPEVQPFQVAQPQPSPVHLTPPETVLNMPEPMNIDIDSPEDIKVTAPQVTVPDIASIELKAPQLAAPEVQTFQVTQSQPSPMHLTPPETVLNMPEPMNIDIAPPVFNSTEPGFNTHTPKFNSPVQDHFDSPLAEIAKPDPIWNSATDPEPLTLPTPEYSVPDIFYPPSKPPELPAVWHKAERQKNEKPDKQQHIRDISIEYKVNPIVNVNGSQQLSGLTESEVRRTVIKVFQQRESELIHALDDALRELYSRHEYLN
ncbi:phage tail tape measure protein [Pseudoalteromonas luteoviolacea]|uniref:phage tail tape measure protein n=1 Tax=Pseudoalteromonas luteoviolacea TaxID=43657 RepID=UPI0011506905|nr:phage tail tape measure protein [Pseudoalteromonas luteoviolacea]TQF71801.1 hypothetical protein FLM44_12265 [Pseudoalteromonas luteoviolacea]